MNSRTIFIISLLTAISFSLQAQPADKYGGDKEACGRNYTIYYEMYKLGQYDAAIPFWQKTVSICPKFSLGLWKSGEKMYQKRIDALDPSIEREGLIDSLLWIYDQRIIHFGNDPRSSKGYVLGRKALSVLKYKKANSDQAYAFLGESLALEGAKSKSDIVLTYMQVSRHLFKDGMINAENVLQDYELCMSIIDAKLLDKPNDKLITRARQGIETHFTKSGAADCDALLSVYESKFSDNNTDKEWLKKVRRQLKTASCTDNDFFLNLTIAMFDIEPSGDAARDIARMFLQREDYGKAAIYLENALELNLPDEDKAKSWYELGYIQYNHFKNYSDARSSARNALAIRPNWGDPYLLIGKVYVDVRETVYDEEFDQNTMFWAAVDQFAMAKKVDPEIAEKADELIQTYSRYFPSSETMFYYGLKDGQDYTIGSWINVKTKAKARK